MRTPLHIFLLRSAIVATVLECFAALSCGGLRGASRSGFTKSPDIFFVETFDNLESVQRSWSAVVPEIVGATTRIEEGEALLVLPSAGEIKLVHPLKLDIIRGRRLRVSGRIWTDLPGLNAQVVVATGSSSAGFRPRAHTEPATASPTSLTTTIDVDSDTSRAELWLVLRGQGKAWFDDIKIEVIEETTVEPNIELSQQQSENLSALARVVALIRFRHPSDQAASLDWNAFLPIAIDRIMHVAGKDSLLTELRALFSHIAPTVAFSRTQEHELRALPQSTSGHLVRWRHEGLGPGTPFKSWRDGQDSDLAILQLETAVDLPWLVRCRSSQLRAVVRGVGAYDEVSVYARVEQAGFARKRFDRKITATDHAISLDFDMPADAYRVHLGIELRGRSSAALEALSLACVGAGAVDVDIARAAWEPREATDLYTWELRNCGAARCLTAARRPSDTTFVTTRDYLSVEILDHLWIHMPLAVWSDGVHTLPAISSWISPRPSIATDVAQRISVLASAWMVLSTFYPYTQDQKIDWKTELPLALASGAAAHSIHDTYVALSRLIAKAHDAHALAIHTDFPIDGLLPIVMRRFGDKLVVVGGLGDYIKLVPIGSEVLAIDGGPVMQAYRQLRERISSSTEGWETWAVPNWLTRGQLGSFAIVHIRSTSGRDTDVILPRLSRELYNFVAREPRPAFGAILAPNVYYVDLQDLRAERWQAVLTSLVQAKAIILDMRGYPSNVVFSMIGHFIDKEVRSPLWQFPILESSNFKTSYFVIEPMSPRIPAKLFVLLDGRAASAAETFLQIMHDNQLAVFVGETSAGTNGTPNMVALPGDFTLRFTGMRVPFRDGSALQGHGIVPDVIVHPTLEGIRAGRDEILEASIDLASRLPLK